MKSSSDFHVWVSDGDSWSDVVTPGYAGIDDSITNMVDLVLPALCLTAADGCHDRGDDCLLCICRG